MPKAIFPVLAVLTALAFIPPALVARARVATSKRPRVHFVLDMDQQAKWKSQQRNPAFADGRAMRPPVPGTVARGEVLANDHLLAGKVDGEWATTFPMPVTGEMMRRGRERFAIFCSPCHGLSGDGAGPVAERADELMQGGVAGNWTIPSDLTDAERRKRPVGNLYNTIRYGIRNMPAYGPQIPVEDRWAIVLYVKALQRSRNATIDDVPPEFRERLR